MVNFISTCHYPLYCDENTLWPPSDYKRMRPPYFYRSGSTPGFHTNGSLSSDSTVQCVKCTNIVQNLTEMKNLYVDGHGKETHIRGDMAPKISFSNESRRLYDSNSLCIRCQHCIHLGTYDQIGGNLIKAHEAAANKDAVPREGCCYVCLLMFQLKCRNGFLESARLIWARYAPSLVSFESRTLPQQQFFSDVLEKPVAINQYLPQGAVAKKQICIIPRKIHAPTVKSWLLSCEANHKCEQRHLRNSPISNVHERIFIDVKNQNLVNRPPNSRYVALSYVWGGVFQLQLTKSNKHTMFQTGALNSLLGNIPQVIQDAILFVSSIEEELLWVDSICIVQDDELVKHRLISEMASIYSGALVTIVAASSKNAGDHLPGVRESSRVLHDMTEVPGTGLSIMTRRSLDFIMDQSTYNMRGWTFQERLLSRRRIYFTETQMFFECQQCLYSEDRLPANLLDSEFSGSIARTNWSCSIFDGSLDRDVENQQIRYNELVGEYSRKKFTFADDILNAFAGIGAAIEDRYGCSMIYGLPESRLDYAMLWEPDGQEGMPTLQRQAYFDEDSAALRYYANNTAHNSAHNSAREQEMRNPNFPSWSWASWKGPVRYNDFTASELQVLHSPFKIVHHSSLSTSTYQSPLNNANSSAIMCPPSILHFNTHCLLGSFFSLKMQRFRDQYTCLITNTRGLNIGIIPGAGSSLVSEHEHPYNENISLILLSASKLTPHRFQSQHDLGYPAVFDGSYRLAGATDKLSVLTVLLVRWYEVDRCSRRLALAYVHAEAWKEAQPKMKEIWLA
ncbi:hypothetical protein ACMFMG_003181 [Clarireedia jacksonii]